MSTRPYIYFLCFYLGEVYVCVFLRFTFLLWFFGSKSRESLVLSFENGMMYIYRSFYSYYIQGIENAFIDFFLLLVRYMSLVLFITRLFRNSLCTNVLISIATNKTYFFSFDFAAMLNNEMTDKSFLGVNILATSMLR